MLRELCHNRVLWTGLSGWLAAQLIKTLWQMWKERRITFSRLVGSGGMPSSHTSLVMSMSVMTGRVAGFDSVLFAIAMCLSLIVMYDACNVRQEAGNHARLLNRLHNADLKESLGHTGREVLAGAVLGVLIGLVIPIAK